MVLSSRGQKLLLMDFSQESENFFPPVHWWGKHSLGGSTIHQLTVGQKLFIK